MKIIFAIIIFPTFVFAQQRVKGIIINSNTKIPIPYATLGLMNKNIGTTSSENGLFEIQCNAFFEKDSLLITCTGYEPRVISFNLKDSAFATIELKENVIALDEIIISPKKDWAYVTVNDFTSFDHNYVSSTGFVTQLAQHFKLPQQKSILCHIKIGKLGGLFKNSKSIFKIHIYDIDSITKGPSAELTTALIEVKSTKAIVNIDVKKYKIFIPNSDFFIAIEWLKIPYNKMNHTQIVNGTKSEHITYLPSISYIYNGNSIYGVWMLDYKNVWRINSKSTGNKGLAIAATVKY